MNHQSDNKKVLLIEDNPDDEFLTLREFKKNKIENEVIVVRDGQEALDWLFCTGQYVNRDPNEVPAVILLDLKLPKVDGMEVLQRIREDSKTKLFPVIVLTSSREEDDIIESYEHGANSYVRKPIDILGTSEVLSSLGVYWLYVNEMPPKKMRRKPAKAA